MTLMRRSLHSILAGVLAILLASVFSCSVQDTRILVRNDLFSLHLGKSENSMDLFQPDGVRSLRKNRIFMRNGIFYISNGNSSKIMKFSSYGDLLGLIYNPQVNPVPVLLGDSTSGKLTNKVAFPYTFEELGEITVLHDGTILAEDQVPESQKIYDDKLETTLNRIIIRFSGQGEYQDYLGQEGIGGTPFPFIDWIQVGQNDDLTVLCRSPESWLVYSFDRLGKRRYVTAISTDTLPLPEGEGVTPSLVGIRPDPESDQLFLLINYYPQTDSSVRPDATVKPVESRIYRLNLRSRTYESWFELPYETQRPGKQLNQDGPSYQSLYNFLGITMGTKLLFMNRKAEGLYQLSIFDVQGRNVAKRYMELDDARIMDINLHTSSSGVISALMSYDDKVTVAWWRADALLGQSVEGLQP